MSITNKTEIIKKARVLSLKYGEAYICKIGKLIQLSLSPIGEVKVLFINGEMLAA